MFLLLTNTIAQFWTRGVVKPVLSITTMFRWPFNELWATSRVLVAHNTVKNFKRWYVNECIPHTKKIVVVVVVHLCPLASQLQYGSAKATFVTQSFWLFYDFRLRKPNCRGNSWSQS